MSSSSAAPYTRLLPTRGKHRHSPSQRRSEDPFTRSGERYRCYSVLLYDARYRCYSVLLYDTRYRCYSVLLYDARYRCYSVLLYDARFRCYPVLLYDSRHRCYPVLLYDARFRCYLVLLYDARYRSCYLNFLKGLRFFVRLIYIIADLQFEVKYSSFKIMFCPFTNLNVDFSSFLVLIPKTILRVEGLLRMKVLKDRLMSLLLCSSWFISS